MMNLFYLGGFVLLLLGFILYLYRGRQRPEASHMRLICRICLDKNGDLIRFILAARPARSPIPVVPLGIPDPLDRDRVRSSAPQKPTTSLVSTTAGH
jgi:hypothetical protein